MTVAKGLSLSDLRDMQLVDLYQGASLPTGKVSLAFRLIFAHPENTLTEEEVNRHTHAIFLVLETAFSAQLRS